MKLLKKRFHPIHMEEGLTGALDPIFSYAYAMKAKMYTLQKRTYNELCVLLNNQPTEDKYALFRLISWYKHDNTMESSLYPNLSNEHLYKEIFYVPSQDDIEFLNQALQQFLHFMVECIFNNYICDLKIGRSNNLLAAIAAVYESINHIVPTIPNKEIERSENCFTDMTHQQDFRLYEGKQQIIYRLEGQIDYLFAKVMNLAEQYLIYRVDGAYFNDFSEVTFMDVIYQTPFKIESCIVPTNMYSNRCL